MSLVRFRNDFSPVERSLDRLMKNFLGDDFDGFFVKPLINNRGPAVNVSENKDNFRLEFASPGFSKNDFNIKVDGNLLTVSAEKKAETKKVDEKFNIREYNFSSFSRTFTLPESVDASGITAEYSDGILKVSVPKKEEVKQKAVEIKVS